MSTAQTGARRERQVRDHLTANGWVPIMRAAGSKGPADLFLAHPVHGGALVQVGSVSKTLGPADRERLVTAAELCGALALLAVVVPRQPIKFYVVTRETPGKWEGWAA